MFPQVPNSLSHLKFKRVNYRKCYYYEDKNIIVFKSYNTIVASFDKKNRNVFIDEYKYSGFTGQHISLFCHSIIKDTVNKYIYINQTHLIKTIISVLNKQDIVLNFRYDFNSKDLIKPYRLHKIRGRIYQIAKPGMAFAYAYRVNKTWKDDYLTPTYYLVKDVYIKDESREVLKAINTQNIRLLGGGV